MANTLIRSFLTSSSAVIYCLYDFDARTFDVMWTGEGDVPASVTEEELGVDDDTEVLSTCYNGDRFIFNARIFTPFLDVDITEDSLDCVVITPPPPPPPNDPPPVTTLNYIAYQVRFKNFEEQIVTANIFDQSTYEEGRTIEYRPLKPSGDPVRLECLDADENKFTPIRAKQCIISFNSSSQIDLNTFAEGHDNRWYVEVSIESQLIFKGFLVLDDLSEAFLSPPNVVTLTATDNIGLLKSIPLTNFAGENPKGKFRWLDYLGWALSKTSLSLPINIQHNLREEHNPFEPFWSRIYLDAKTFEDEIGTCINCYEVLERLLAEECFLTQRHGEWWIVRVDEIDNRWGIRRVYYVDPLLTHPILYEPTLQKTVKKTQDIKWINRTAYVKPTRPHGKVKERYSFQYPKEIIDNIDFTRGGQILVGVYPPNEFHYHFEDWTLFKDNLFAQTAGTGQAEIVRIFENGYEKERYLMVAGNGAFHWLKSNGVPMMQKDKFTVSVDFRSTVNVSGSIIFFIQILLVAGSITYIYGGLSGTNPDNYAWAILTNTVVQNWGIFLTWDGSTRDEREWQTIAHEVKPLPVDGDIHVLLTAGASEQTHYQNLQFTYQPYINGSYQRFSGQYWQVTQEGIYKAAIDEEVYISDSPKPLFKGAMKYFDFPAGKYALAGDWFDNSLNPVPPLPAVYRPYGWFQAQSVWNQYRRVMRIFDGELLGITENDLPDLIHSYTLGDPSPHTRLREFICLHYSMSLKTCRWTAYFAEVFKSDEAKVYTDTTEFKYIESR